MTVKKDKKIHKQQQDIKYVRCDSYIILSTESNSKVSLQERPEHNKLEQTAKLRIQDGPALHSVQKIML
jgi:hypothetical protein